MSAATLIDARERSARREQVAVAFGLLLLAVAAPLIDAPNLWPLAALGGVVSAMLLWGALGHESLVAPVIGVVGTCVPFMYATDRPAIGALTGVVLAMALGEHLAVVRNARYVTPGSAVRWSSRSALTHAGAAAAAACVTMLLTALPELRAWSGTAVVVLGLAAIVLQRRRAALREVPLPPPSRLE